MVASERKLRKAVSVRHFAFTFPLVTSHLCYLWAALGHSCSGLCSLVVSCVQSGALRLTSRDGSRRSSEACGAHPWYDRQDSVTVLPCVTVAWYSFRLCRVVEEALAAGIEQIAVIVQSHDLGTRDLSYSHQCISTKTACALHDSVIPIAIPRTVAGNTDTWFAM